MSRGPGRLQRAMLGLFYSHIGKPLTFEEIKTMSGTRKRTAFEILDGVGTEWQHRERSLRRALTKLVGDNRFGQIITIGKGGPGDPYRYHVNPIALAMAGKEEALRLARQACEANAGLTL